MGTMARTLRIPSAGLRIAPDLQRLQLEELDLENNRLQTLENLPLSLKRLNVSHNAFLNDGIFYPFPVLEHLNISHNRVNIFEEDDFLACFPSLVSLDFSYNCLKQVKFLQDSNLTNLNVSHTRLQTLYGLPRSTKELDANSCSITMVQSKLPPTLEFLDLCYNSLRFAGLPLNWPNTLKELHLDRNDIERFPRKLPDSLEVLTLSGNCLTELPSRLPSSLRYCIVSGNRIRTLPDYKKTHRFQLFLIDDNCLTEIPETFPSIVFHTDSNWNETIHHESQGKIKQCWKRYLLRLRLRHYKRIRTVKEELFMVSMMPERWEQIDALDPIWFRKSQPRNHTDPH